MKLHCFSNAVSLRCSYEQKRISPTKGLEDHLSLANDLRTFIINRTCCHRAQHSDHSLQGRQSQSRPLCVLVVLSHLFCESVSFQILRMSRLATTEELDTPEIADEYGVGLEVFDEFQKESLVCDSLIDLSSFHHCLQEACFSFCSLTFSLSK